LRQEKKEVDGFELESEEERKRQTDLVDDDERELHDLDGLPEYEREQERTSLIAAAMHDVLDGEHIILNDWDLPQRELRALEALKTAVDGRDQEIHGFVFAEDRRSLLEQALAVLQPDLANLEKVGGTMFAELVKNIGELRLALQNLEDAQDEVERKRESDKGEASDTDDKPKPDADRSLTGPERKIDKPASSLVGPERAQDPKPASSLYGPDAKEEPKAASTLVGPELAAAPKPETSLGDATEIKETAKKPWWKRLTGG
jgi:hypothetical protein